MKTFTLTPKSKIKSKRKKKSKSIKGKILVWGFKEKVLEVVLKIPKGKVLTYKEVAKRAGNPKASRAVGNILHRNNNLKIPCHRVIRSDGKAGGYNNLRGKNKAEILRREGCII